MTNFMIGNSGLSLNDEAIMTKFCGYFVCTREVVVEEEVSPSFSLRSSICEVPMSLSIFFRFCQGGEH